MGTGGETPLPSARLRHQRHGGQGLSGIPKGCPPHRPLPQRAPPMVPSSAAQPLFSQPGQKDVTQSLDWRHRPGRMSARTSEASAAAAQHPPSTQRAGVKPALKQPGNRGTPGRDPWEGPRSLGQALNLRKRQSSEPEEQWAPRPARGTARAAGVPRFRESGGVGRWTGSFSSKASEDPNPVGRPL